MGEPVTVLEDSQNGWKALCQDLKQVDNIPEGKTCSDMCKEDLWCSEWALVKNWKGEEQCWAGLGDRCYKTHGYEGQLVQAQRIMHGHHRVLRDLRFAEVDGLVYVDVTNDGGITATAQADGAQRCKNTCLSLVNCQIWIYHKSSGCWIEWPYKHRVQYPATAASWGIARSQDVVAGEYMQRVCGDLSGTPGVAPAPPPLPNQPITPGAPLPTVCETNNKAPLTAACQCASNVDGNECMPGMYCWEGNTCASSPKPDRTLPDEDDDEIIPVASNGSDWEKIVVGIAPCSHHRLLRPSGSRTDVHGDGVEVARFGFDATAVRSGGREGRSREQWEGSEFHACSPWLRIESGAAVANNYGDRLRPLCQPASWAAAATGGVYAPCDLLFGEQAKHADGGSARRHAGGDADDGRRQRKAGCTANPSLGWGARHARPWTTESLPELRKRLHASAVFCRRCGEPRSVFDMIDTNHDGFITPEEWKRF